MTVKEKAPTQTMHANSDELLARAQSVALRMDLLKDPQATVAASGNDEIYRKWLEINERRAMHAVAAELGIEPSELERPERTERQETLLKIARLKARKEDLQTYLESCYLDAIFTVAGKEGVPEDDLTLHELSALYFFALHPDIDPLKETTLTDAGKEELLAIFGDMESFLGANPEAKNLGNDSFLKCFMEHRETGDAAAQLAKELPRLQSVLPAKHTMPNNYLANELQHGGIIDAGLLNLPVLGDSKKARKGGELITTSVIATYQPGEGVTIKGNYTEYDRQVQDAVCSLWQYGDIGHIFTPAMIYRAMTNNAAVQPSPQQIGAVTRSIEKQRRIHVQVDASAEFEKRGIADENGRPIHFKVGEFLLVLKDLEVTAGGKTVKGYYIKEAPLLLTYSRLTKQLLTVKSELLDIRRIDSKRRICESIANTESRIAIKGYLLRRIEVLKYDTKRAKDNFRKYQNRRSKDRSLPEKEASEFMQQSTRILFDTVFEETGQESTSRETQRRNREFAMQCLDYWKATGHIKGYSIVKGERNAIRGVDLQI